MSDDTRGPDTDFDGNLLDLHLGHLSTAEREQLQQRIANDPELSAQHNALSSAFAALRIDTTEPMPPDLIQRTRARVRAAGPAPRVIRPADDLTRAVEERSERVIKLGNLRQIVGLAAMIVLAIGVGVPSLLHMRERAQRIGCSRNLQALGYAVQQYATTFNASLPFAGWTKHASWQPNGAPDVVTIPNRRHVYPLLQARFVADPGVFVCPARRDVPMPSDQILRRNDFPEARNLSYAYQNMAGVRPSAKGDPNLPIMSDDNPLFDGGLAVFSGRSPDTTNSRAHRGAGQNILTLRGEVKWATTPRAGINGDNIWILQQVTDYTGREGPTSPTDSHLLK